MPSTNTTGELDSWTLPVATPLGVFTAEFTSRGLVQLRFPPPPRRQGRNTPQRIPSKVRRWCQLTARALNTSLKGGAPGEIPPLDWREGTLFQRKVWQALLRIPAGRTASYGELARHIGRHGAARAVGSACGANPIPVLVPCHRVTAANGGLGGFSGGLDWKRRLLGAEEARAGL